MIRVRHAWAESREESLERHRRDVGQHQREVWPVEGRQHLEAGSLNLFQLGRVHDSVRAHPPVQKAVQRRRAGLVKGEEYAHSPERPTVELVRAVRPYGVPGELVSRIRPPLTTTVVSSGGASWRMCGRSSSATTSLLIGSSGLIGDQRNTST